MKFKDGDKVQHQVSGEIFTVKAVHITKTGEEKLHFHEYPGWLRAVNFKLVKEFPFKVGDELYWDYELDTVNFVSYPYCRVFKVEDNFFWVRWGDGGQNKYKQDDKRVNSLIKVKDLKYEILVTATNKNDLQETYQARCGHEHTDKRSAGQCSRHYVNKIIKETNWSEDEVSVQVIESTPTRREKFDTIENVFGVEYTPSGGLPVKVNEPPDEQLLVITKPCIAAGHTWQPGTVVTLIEEQGEYVWVKTPDGKKGQWFANRFKPVDKDDALVKQVKDIKNKPVKDAPMPNKLELLAQLLQNDIDDEAVRAIVNEEIDRVNKWRPKLVKIQGPDFTIEPQPGEIQHPQYERLARWISGQVTRVWVFGPAGTGKTHACLQIAKALDLPYYLQPRVADEYQLSGFKDAHGNYHETQIYRWAHDKNPRSVLILDEVDRNLDVVNIWYNAALANGIVVFPDGPVEIEPTKLVIATANTVGHGNSIRYSAAQSQDSALLDRFSLKLPWNIDEATEMHIALNRYPFDKTEKTVEASMRVRAAITDNGIRMEWGPRRTFAACEAVASGEKLKAAFEFAGLNEIEDKNTKKKLLNVV